jgi:hypothetical protein
MVVVCTSLPLVAVTVTVEVIGRLELPPQPLSAAAVPSKPSIRTTRSSLTDRWRRRRRGKVKKSNPRDSGAAGQSGLCPLLAVEEEV